MDRYTKFILTTIAVGVIGLNFHLFKNEIMSPANASSHKVHKIAICNENGTKCSDVITIRGGRGNAIQIYNWPRS